MEEHITLVEFLILGLFLGAPVFGGTAVLHLTYSFRARPRRLPRRVIVTLVLVGQAVAVLASLAIWASWPFAFDFMQGPISLLAVAAEALVVPGFIVLQRILERLAGSSPRTAA